MSRRFVLAPIVAATTLALVAATGCGAASDEVGIQEPGSLAAAVNDTDAAGELDAPTGLKCKKITGTVLLLPEPAGTCTISSKVPGPTYVGNPDPTGSPACFTVKVTGPLASTGYAGLTSEALQFGGTATPATLHEWPSPPFVPTRLVLTARATLADAKGSLQTRDTNIIDLATGTVTEQIIINGGDGAYAGASGAIVVLGNSIGKPAPIAGRLCVPQAP